MATIQRSNLIQKPLPDGVEWVGRSNTNGNRTRLHRIDPDVDQSELENGDHVEVACETSLQSRSAFLAKPANTIPPAYYPLCAHEECFGHLADDEDTEADDD
jgi:hypothetical protein